MGLFIKKKIYSFLCFQNIVTCLSHSTAKYLFKVKNRTLYWYANCDQSQQRKLQDYVMLYLFLTLNTFSRLI